MPAAGPRCGHCQEPALVHWLRRPTAAEFTAVLAADSARRAREIEAADPDGPPPALWPAPTAEATTIAVYACATHAIHLDAAALVHAASCTAPSPGHLPGCDCTPEPAPTPKPLTGPKTTLPTGWVLPA
jgi:hypothetical protein